MTEPEVVFHMLCPNSELDLKTDPDGGASIAPIMTLVQILNDGAGRQRRYVCPRCEAEVAVNFPPEPDHVFVLQDCRDYYGPRYKATFRSLEAAQAFVAGQVSCAPEWRPFPNSPSAADATSWETTDLSWSVDKVEVG